jgi:phage baseplate assembly protein W
MSAFVFGLRGDDHPQNHFRLLRSTSMAESLRQTIRLAIETHLGERLDAPEVGSSLSEFVFRRIHDHTLGEIQSAIARCLHESEPRISVVDVECRYVENEVAKVQARIEYCLVESEEKQTLKHIIDLRR